MAHSNVLLMLFSLWGFCATLMLVTRSSPVCKLPARTQKRFPQSLAPPPLPVCPLRIASHDGDVKRWVAVAAPFGEKRRGTINIHDPSIDTYISGHLARHGQWEQTIVQAMQHVLTAPRMLFVDVGANIGYFSLVASLAGMRVRSFEAAAFNMPLLMRTRDKANNMDWALHYRAVSHESDQFVALETTSARTNAGNHRVVPGASVVTVRLDDVLNEHVDFLKVDVEGYECQVVAGATRLFCEHGVDAVVLEWTQRADRACQHQKLLQWFEWMGYTPRALRTFQTYASVGTALRGEDNLFLYREKNVPGTQACLDWWASATQPV